MIITSVTRMASFRHLLAAMARAQEWADATGEPIMVVRYLPKPELPPFYFATSRLTTSHSEIVARAVPRPRPPRPRESTR